MIEVVDKSVLTGSFMFFAEEIHSLERRGVAYQCYRVTDFPSDTSPGGQALVLSIPSGNRGWIHHDGRTWETDRQYLEELGIEP
jgi:hypothetical protein